MKTLVREATIDDISAILEIVNHSILNSTAIYDYEKRDITQQLQWFNDKKMAGFPVIVSEENSIITGFGTYGTFRIKAAYQFTVEHSVYVAENFKGKGIGKALLSKLIQDAKTAGYHAMIGCIDADNSGSITFHEKFGFKNTGVLREVGYKFDRWLDLVFMQLLLK